MTTPKPNDDSQKNDSTKQQPAVSRRSVLSAGVAGLAGVITCTPAEAAGLGRFRNGRRTARSRRSTYITPAKQQAIHNYRRSLAAYGGKMSSCPSNLINVKRQGVPYDMDIAVIGTGYGGGITAARLAQQMNPGVRLCVMERGKEWIPGTFSDRFRDVLPETRQKMLGRGKDSIDNPIGMFDYVRSNDVDVITGAGLGGTSLINANVAIRPDREVFMQNHWPVALRHREVLDPFYDAAMRELGVVAGPIDSSPKMVAHRRAAARMAARDKFHFAANLAVTFDNRFKDAQGRNPQGMFQPTCNLCGDCIAGCNVGAKNTIQMNYLPLAKRHGAEIYTQVECRHVEKCDGYYRLHMVWHKRHGNRLLSIPFTTTSRVVVLAGGSLGSTGILLRSQACGLNVSGCVGNRWSGNGDALGFVVKTREYVNSAGVGAYASSNPPVGPSIQAITKLDGHGPVDGRILIQDGGMPRAYANIVGTLMRDVPMNNTLVMFGMGHDGTRGKVVLRNGEPVVEWPGIKTSRYRTKVRHHFEQIARGMGGEYKFLKAFGSNLITVHPLGGCGMADDPRYGVVNDRGQVFNGHGGGSVDAATGEALVHSGLYVSDGSVMPGSLGANPFLTISAVAERTAASIAMDAAYGDLFA